MCAVFILRCSCASLTDRLQLPWNISTALAHLSLTWNFGFCTGMRCRPPSKISLPAFPLGGCRWAPNRPACEWPQHWERSGVLGNAPAPRGASSPLASLWVSFVSPQPAWHCLCHLERWQLTPPTRHPESIIICQPRVWFGGAEKLNTKPGQRRGKERQRTSSKALLVRGHLTGVHSFTHSH